MTDQHRKLAFGHELVEQLFPFLLAFDRDLRVVQHGRAVHKVCEGIAVGAPMSALFTVFRPRGVASFEAFRAKQGAVFLLDSLTTKIRMRGEVVHDEPSDLLLFIGTPWFTDVAQLESTGLELKDFTDHDPIVDFIYMVQAKTLALEDARKFSETAARQRDELRVKNEELARASRAKSQFLANTSHELRTPLNGIIGMMSVLARTRLDANQQNYVDKALRSANALHTVVNDVLDFSKMEAGKLCLEVVDFDLDQLIHEVAELFAVSAQAKGIELLCSVTPDVPRAVRGDPSRLRQIIGNLLGNAVKFTERGEVVLRIGVGADTSADAVTLHFDVQDTGIGVSEEHQARLFTAFAQADDSMSRLYGGTGLGLAICKELAARMDGEVGVTSRPGEGSTFWFTARFARVPESVRALPHLAHDELTHMRVLVVDDNAASRELLSSLVARWGVESHGTADALEALGLLREAAARGAPYDVALLDAQMPRMSGLDLARILAGDRSLDPLQIVLLAAVDQAAGKKPKADGPIAAQLTKPVRASRLFNALASIAARRPRPEQRDSGQAPSAPSPPRSLPPTIAGTVLVVDDHPVNQEVASHMLAALGYQVDLASNGREALEALARIPYALVLMDLQMPEMDGYEATAAIRAREGSTRRTPIIAATAHAMESDRQKALDAGMDDYIPKPLNFDVLGALLERWHPGRRALALPHASRPAPAPAPEPAIDWSVLDELRRYQRKGAPDIVASIVGKLVADLVVRLRAVREAAGVHDLRSIAAAAHALKSSSASAGARRLPRIAANLEAACKADDRALVPDLLGAFERECELVRTELEASLRAGESRADAASGEATNAGAPRAA